MYMAEGAFYQGECYLGHIVMHREFILVIETHEHPFFSTSWFSVWPWNWHVFLFSSFHFEIQKGTGYGASAIISGKHIISSASLAVCLLGKVIFLLTAALSWLSVWGYLYTSRMEFATERSLMRFPALPLLSWLHFLHAQSIKHPWHPVLTLVAGGDCWQICIFCIYTFPETLLPFFSLFWGIIDFNKLLAG